MLCNICEDHTPCFFLGNARCFLIHPNFHRTVEPVLAIQTRNISTASLSTSAASGIGRSFISYLIDLQVVAYQPVTPTHCCEGTHLELCCFIQRLHFRHARIQEPNRVNKCKYFVGKGSTDNFDAPQTLAAYIELIQEAVIAIDDHEGPAIRTGLIQ